MHDKLQQRYEKLQKKCLDQEKKNASILYEKTRTSEELRRTIREKNKTTKRLETKAKNLEKQCLTMKNRLAQASTGSSMSRQTSSHSTCGCGKSSLDLTSSNSRKRGQQSGEVQQEKQQSTTLQEDLRSCPKTERVTHTNER